MRPAALTALALSAALVACASPPPPPAPPPAQNWVLLAPPDDPAVMALLENVERLPDSDDRLPQTAVVGLAQPQVNSLEEVFEQTKQLPSADQRGRYLVEKAVMDDQPVSQWRQVRRFSSQEKCERVLRQLQINTNEMDRQTEYRVGMRMEELEWPVMALSFGQGQCVYDVG
jgi:hypothetical protein